MDFTLLYWHWIVFGIGLMLLEIFIGSFFIFWFGAAAAVVGLLLLPFPGMTVTAQVIIWAVLTTACAVVWFKYLKNILNRDKTKAGLSREALIGEIGHVLSAPNGEKRGKIRFPAPLLGSDEWLIISQDALTPGDRASVVDLSGNSLIVKKA